MSFQSVGYTKIVKPILFKINPETVHEHLSARGELLGSSPLGRQLTKAFFYSSSPLLKQTIAGIDFSSPIGLAAGFDYNAQLTQITPSLGFGFQTVGTITNSSYEGNPKPMLGRLPLSKSLMVNKGFKNMGARKTAQKLKKLHFDIPIGISIGRTNTLALKTQKQSIADIVAAFSIMEKAKLKTAYYELNISCPNLVGNISFYPPKNLNDLLVQIDKLKLTKQVFIKMPIEKTNREVRQMLDIIVKHNIAGVIFGNLQKNRQDPSLNPAEVAKFSVGYFSGKPTWKRSNELIQMSYRHYHKKLIIIGCGGVFSPEDAYQKIKLGASLVQLITGMIYQGPNLIGEINKGLDSFLKRDGFTDISEAIGVDNKKRLLS